MTKGLASGSICETCCCQLNYEYIDYINKCKVLCKNCRYGAIAWLATQLVKRNGSDVFGEMKDCPCSWTTPARRTSLAPPVVTTKTIYKLTSQFYPSCHSHKIPTTKITLHNIVINHEKILTICDLINGCYALLNIAHPHTSEVAAFEIFSSRKKILPFSGFPHKNKDSVLAMVQHDRVFESRDLPTSNVHHVKSMCVRQRECMCACVQVPLQCI